MKLSLTHEKGVEVLVAQGSVADRDVKVLRAGLAKILKTGKNKIVLELEEALDISTDAIRELVDLDVLARELSGRIVLAGIGPELRTKIEAFAKPPVIACFASRDEAIGMLTAPPKAELPDLPSLEVSKELEKLRFEEGALKKRLQDLENENRALKEQVVLATIARRSPAGEAEYQQRIQFLETKLESLLTTADQAPKDQPSKGGK